jgi:hypothetical protein
MNPLRTLILLLTLLLAACTAKPELEQIPGSARSGDLVVYVGIVPAAMARERMAADATPQHPAPAAATDAHHLVVALFDAASGARIEQAGVIAIHLSPRGTPVRRTMVPMRTGGVTSFGAEFPISKGSGHLFEIEVTRPGRPSARSAFRYDNEH